MLTALLALAAGGLLAGCLVSFSGPNENNNNIPPGCGNGILDMGETCDGTSFGTLTCETAVVGRPFGELACSPSCSVDPIGCHSCGNGVIDPGEDCDDGSAIAGNGCDSVCREEHGWSCEGEPSVCFTVCGDGLVAEGVESCDDGDTDPGDGCDALCAKEPGWSCAGEPSICAPTCGNGALDAGEACDDGDAEPGDGCGPSCEVETGFTCDEAAPSVCTPICGDGLVLGGEACDDGGDAQGDGCDSTCTVEEGWICEGQAPSFCRPICGDGLLRGSEPCDDADLSPGDGCDASCQVEPFFGCDQEPSQCGCVVYVNVSATTGSQNGDSWANAHVNLRSALGVAANRAPCEVWVAAGTYHAYEGSPGNSFEVRSNVSLYGGFAGSETRRTDRDWVAHQVILHASHALNPLQVTRRVVEAIGSAGTEVDGVTVTGANNGGGRGGGVAVYNGGNLTLRHSRVEGNHADAGGGGIWGQGSQLTLLDVQVFGNTASSNGAGILLENGQVAVLDSVDLVDNVTTVSGGAIFALDSSLTVRGSLFRGNRASNLGGALRVEQSGLFAENCLFVENEATTQGGGGVSLARNTGAPWEIRSCTFHGNLSNTQGSGFALRVYEGTVSVWSSILWGTLDQQISLLAGAVANLDRCDIAQATPTGANLNQDPLFVDPANHDFRLRPLSPCIDAANGSQSPGTDRDGNSRWDDPAVIDTGSGTPTYADIGCYERQQ